jgi:hypothetical protein
MLLERRELAKDKGQQTFVPQTDDVVTAKPSQEREF